MATFPFVALAMASTLAKGSAFAAPESKVPVYDAGPLYAQASPVAPAPAAKAARAPTVGVPASPQKSFLLGVRAMSVGYESSTSKFTGSDAIAGTSKDREPLTCKSTKTDVVALPLSLFSSLLGFVRFTTTAWVFDASIEPVYTANASDYQEDCKSNVVSILGLDRIPSLKIGYLITPSFEAGLQTRLVWTKEKGEKKEESSTFVDAGPYVRPRMQFSPKLGFEGLGGLFVRSSSGETKETKTTNSSSSGSATTPKVETDSKETTKGSGFGADVSAHLLVRATDAVEIAMGVGVHYVASNEELTKEAGKDSALVTSKRKNEDTTLGVQIDLLQLRASF